jgi:hypothetical protein
VTINGFANDGFTSRRSIRRSLLHVVVVVARDVLVGGLPEHLVPLNRVEIGKFGWIRGNGGEPIIKDDVKLGRDGARLQVQDERDGGRVLIAEANVDATLGAGAPTRQLVSVRKAAIKHVDRATPHMDVLKLRLSPAGPGEEVVGRDSSRLGRHVVPEVDGLLHGHRPQLRVGDLRPMNRSVEHHRAGDRHDGLDRPLGDSVVVMGPDAGEANRLLKRRQVAGEGVRREGFPVVGLVLLRDDANITAKQLVLFLGSKGLVGVQMGLKLDMDVARSVVNEDTAARVHVALVGLAAGREETAFRSANEVINRNTLPWEEVVSA